jgi:hypothetical protein
MKHFLILSIFLAIAFLSNGQESKNLDKRHILFYLFNNKTTQSERVSKTLGKSPDSLIMRNIELIFENNNGDNDTIKCNYKNNTILFSQMAESKDSITNIFLSVELNIKNKQRPFNERLTVPFKNFYMQTNDKSDISIVFDRKRNNLFLVTISKLDFPFISFTSMTTSEVIGLHYF